MCQAPNSHKLYASAVVKLNLERATFMHLLRCAMQGPPDVLVSQQLTANEQHAGERLQLAQQLLLVQASCYDVHL